MKRIFTPTLVAAALLCVTATAAELESGPKVGASAGAFTVKDVTGPASGKSLCYR